MTTEQFPDISSLPYEQARDELVAIVARLETGQVPLEDGMALWHRAEALAAHCTAWLDDAQASMEKAQADQAETDRGQEGEVDAGLR